MTSTGIFLFLPSDETIYFSAQMYKARYTLSSSKLDLEGANIEVLGIDAQEDIEMTLIDDSILQYSQYFIPSYSTESKEWIISVNETNPLPQDIFKLKTLVPKLRAKDNGVTAATATSVLVIELPEIDNDSKFSKNYYTGNYSNKNEITMNEDIVLTGTTLDDITFYFDGKFMTDIFYNY